MAEQRGEAVRVGYFIAETILPPSAEFSVEDLAEPEQHMTVWGAAAELAALVSDVYPAETEGS